MLDFSWRERAGPKVTSPKRRGFGTTLLEKVVTVQCQAEIDLKYHTDGLQFAMRLPLRHTRLVPPY
jgi:two-component sensor histidine kinase